MSFQSEPRHVPIELSTYPIPHSPYILKLHTTSPPPQQILTLLSTHDPLTAAEFKCTPFSVRSAARDAPAFDAECDGDNWDEMVGRFVEWVVGVVKACSADPR